MLTERERALVLVGLAMQNPKFAQAGMDPLEVSAEVFQVAAAECDAEFDTRLVKLINQLREVCKE